MGGAQRRGGVGGAGGAKDLEKAGTKKFGVGAGTYLIVSPPFFLE